MGNGITHWLDYPIHDLVLLVQTAVLRDLLASDRLTRIKDLELNNQLRRVNSEDEYTQAFLLETRDRIEKTLNAPLVGN
ncbi:hypothetical protein BMF77_00964 [Dolichospermum sp. UHCC 0315A]|nr:hypothetical protein BMF77_00964 [Dolichospermum sp. UHCC 0315A]